MGEGRWGRGEKEKEPHTQSRRWGEDANNRYYMRWQAVAMQGHGISIATQTHLENEDMQRFPLDVKRHHKHASTTHKLGFHTVSVHPSKYSNIYIKSEKINTHPKEYIFTRP